MNTFTSLISIGLLVLIILVLHSINSTLSLPDVHFTPSNECVRVINYIDKQFNCEDLPSKYHYIYVPQTNN